MKRKKMYIIFSIPSLLSIAILFLVIAIENQEASIKKNCCSAAKGVMEKGRCRAANTDEFNQLEVNTWYEECMEAVMGK